MGFDEIATGDFGIKVLRALGLQNAKCIRSILIEIRPNDLVSVVISKHILEEESNQLIDVLEHYQIIKNDESKTPSFWTDL
jgi:hypothetical protein